MNLIRYTTNILSGLLLNSVENTFCQKSIYMDI